MLFIKRARRRNRIRRDTAPGLGAMAEISRTNHLCFLPQGVGPEEMIQELKKWHDAHREAWQNSASDAARSAFLAAWHCSH